MLFAVPRIDYAAPTVFNGLFMPSHLVVLALIAVLLFGAKQLPQLGRQLGKGVRSVRDTAGEYGLEELTELRETVRDDLQQTVKALPRVAGPDAPASPTPKS